MKVKTIISALVLAMGVSIPAMAQVQCPQAKVQMIKSSDDGVFIQLEGQSWQKLANNSDTDALDKLILAQTAKRKGQKVQLSFPQGHDAECIAREINGVRFTLSKSKRSESMILALFDSVLSIAVISKAD